MSSGLANMRDVFATWKRPVVQKYGPYARWKARRKTPRPGRRRCSHLHAAAISADVCAVASAVCREKRSDCSSARREPSQRMPLSHEKVKRDQNDAVASLFRFPSAPSAGAASSAGGRSLAPCPLPRPGLAGPAEGEGTAGCAYAASEGESGWQSATSPTTAETAKTPSRARATPSSGAEPVESRSTSEAKRRQARRAESISHRRVERPALRPHRASNSARPSTHAHAAAPHEPHAR
mmetsp:Transcript_22223/g.73748  ORF Transcript_22223/g.73748 Transcript_22223/m.73748 type:complete len:237 (-) Transcript_22223:231-941(-)